MTQDEYNLFTGESLEMEGESWAIVLEVAEARLASFLCLEEFPTKPDNSLKMLLANFICAVFRHQGNGTERVEEKSVRNFTVRFATDDAVDAFSQVADNYKDLIEMYSECEIDDDGDLDLSLKVEHGVRHYWEEW